MTTQIITDGVTLSAASWGNDVDTATYSGLTSVAGTANAITAVGPASMTAYAARLGFTFIPASTNTGAATINLTCNSVALGARNIFYNGVALTGGELRKSIPARIIDDGTRFHLVESANTPVLRAHLAGLTLSTAGASTTMTTAAGMAADSTNAVMMNLVSSIGKTTSAWAVGTGNGGLDTGAIATGTWYHFYEIMRDDTNVVDVLFSLSASAPTMPTNYSYFRRIGSGKTNGSSQWSTFVQYGDLFMWGTISGDVNASNPGASAVTRTLNVPTGVSVQAQIQAMLSNSGSGVTVFSYFSDLATTDSTPSSTISDLPETAAASGTSRFSAGRISIQTNTSGQIRSRLSNSDASVALLMNTLGWIDRRGRDS